MHLKTFNTKTIVNLDSNKQNSKSSPFNLILSSVTLCAVITFAAGCNSNDKTKPSDNTITTSSQVGTLIEKDCWTPDLVAVEASCGVLLASRDYDLSSGTETRQVGYAILPATGSTTVDDIPLVILAGGPGLSGTASATQFASGAPLDFLRKRREVIIVDYRGVGSSEPALTCAEPNDPTGVAACRRAVDGNGMDVSEMRSAVFARDVDQLLASLNHSKALLYGLSYGSRVALTMLRDRPSRVAGAVLDGVLPVEVNGFSQRAIAPLAGLDSLVKRCETTPSCPQTLGDMRSQIEALVSKWSAAGVSHELQLTGLVVLARIAYHPAAPLLLASLKDMSAMDTLNTLRQYAEFSSSDGDPGQAVAANIPADQAFRTESMPMTLSVVCAEEAAFTGSQHLENSPHYPYGFSDNVIDTIRPFTGSLPIDTEAANTICSVFGARAAAALETDAVYSMVPTLILNGGMDMQTPVAWGNQVALNLTESTNVLIPLSDHITGTSSGCAQSIIEQFTDNPKQQPDTGCAEDLLKPVILQSTDITGEFF